MYRLQHCVLQVDMLERPINVILELSFGSHQQLSVLTNAHVVLGMFLSDFSLISAPHRVRG